MQHTTVYKTTENKAHCGSPKKLNATKVTGILREVIKYPIIRRKTLDKDIAVTTGIVLTPWTIQNYLNKVGRRAQKPRKKP